MASNEAVAQSMNAVTGGVSSFSGITGYIIVFLCIIVIGALVLIGVYFFYTNSKFNKKIIFFTKVGRSLQIYAQDKAMFQRVGDAGDQWCVTKQMKKIFPLPKLQMGKNTFWMFKREDGEFINFTLGDLDEQQKKIGAYFVDEDMRLQRLGIQKNLRDRLMQESWWKKYGTTLIFMIFIIFTVVMQIVQFKYYSDTQTGSMEMARAIKEMAIAVSNLARGVGGGVIPA